MMIESLADYVRRGRGELALRIIREEKDGIVRAELLAEMLRLVDNIDDYHIIREELINTKNFAKDRRERAIILSIIGEALASVGEENEATKFFKEAIKTASKVPLLPWRAETLAGVGINLAKAGLYGDAYDVFTKAFETLILAREEDPEKAIPAASRVADSIVMSVDLIDDAHWVVLFLELAAEVYDFIGLSFSANSARAKAKIVERALWGDIAYLRVLLAENRIDDAILLVKYFPEEYRALGLLELSFWLYANDHSELAKPLFEDAYDLLTEARRSGKDINEREIASIAADFAKLGKPELASRLANLISDEKLLSDVLARVAVAYYNQGDEFLARTIAQNIPIESIKSRVLQQIGGEVHVGYKQGLSLIGGGEER